MARWRRRCGTRGADGRNAKPIRGAASIFLQNHSRSLYSTRLDTQSSPKEPNHERNGIAIDLTKVRFMNSAGVGLRLRIKKQGRLHSMEVVFLNPQPNVLNAVRTLRLDQYLFGESGKGLPSGST
ncbi:MAG: STAS domain-containing protein [Verrucomicrobiia bacterium]